MQRNENGTLPAYAWPGGYPIYYLFADGEVCCPDCANGENGSQAHEDRDGDHDWLLVGQQVHYEGETLACVHCNRQIESAYGNPNEENK